MMKKLHLNLIFTLFLLLIMVINCQPPKQKVTKETPINNNYMKLPYDLFTPDKKFKLQASLKEISGISYVDENLFACIQDEEGTIFYYNTKEKEIVSKIEFKDKGDFEDLCVIKNQAWVLRSDGTLFFINISNNETQLFETPLSEMNNTEGLTFDAETNQLLIACKEVPNIENSQDLLNKRAIYSFDLGKKKINLNPKFIIPSEELIEIIENGTGKTPDEINFAPSAIGIHPLSKNIYVLSSVGKLLVVLSHGGEIIHVHKLSKDIFKQPEGIAFAPDGTLYISNEGKKGKGNILKFNMLN